MNEEKLTLDKYQELAMTTALESARNESYMAFGLANEIGEFQEKIMLLNEAKTTKEETGAELGDVCWYIAGNAFMQGRKLSEIFGSNAVVSEIHAESVPQEKLLALGAQMSVVAGEFLGVLKKRIRDGVYKQEKAEASVKALISLVANAAESLDTSIDAIMNANLEKLFSRKARGVLGGSGDNR